MLGAYIQIIIMLLGAFLLGMFVAWQYWKKKFNQLQEQYRQLEEQSSKTIKGLEEKVASLQKDGEEKDKQIAASEKSLEEKEKSIAKHEKEIQTLSKKVDKLNGDVKKKSQKIKETEEKIEVLGKEVEVLDQELVAAHDELYSLTKERKKSTYYKYIKGKRYKAATLKEAEAAAEGKGDGRISMEDARKIFSTISDGKQYTPVEKATIRYLRENFKWTEQADELFRHLVGSWAAHDHNVDEITE